MAKAKDDAVRRSTDPVKKADPGEKKGLGKRIAQWFRDLKSELSKVIWPTRSQIVNNTLVALVVMVVAAIVIWGFDSLASMGVKALISLV